MLVHQRVQPFWINRSIMSWIIVSQPFGTAKFHYQRVNPRDLHGRALPKRLVQNLETGEGKKDKGVLGEILATLALDGVERVESLKIMDQHGSTWITWYHLTGAGFLHIPLIPLLGWSPPGQKQIEHDLRPGDCPAAGSSIARLVDSTRQVSTKKYQDI